MTLGMSLSTINTEPLGELAPFENLMNIYYPTGKQKAPTHFTPVSWSLWTHKPFAGLLGNLGTLAWLSFVLFSHKMRICKALPAILKILKVDSKSRDE